MEKCYLAVIKAKSYEEDVPEASVPKTDTVEPSNNALITDETALVNKIQINRDVLRDVL